MTWAGLPRPENERRAKFYAHPSCQFKWFST